MFWSAMSLGFLRMNIPSVTWKSDKLRMIVYAETIAMVAK